MLLLNLIHCFKCLCVFCLYEREMEYEGCVTIFVFVSW